MISEDENRNMNILKKSLKRSGLSLALLFAVVSNPVAAKRGEILTSLKEWRYLRMRAYLLGHGYIPITVRTRDTPDEICPGLINCSTYPELVTCSGTGMAFCDSVFFDTKNKRYIKVISYGEGEKSIYAIYYATNADLREWGFRSRRSSRRH